VHIPAKASWWPYATNDRRQRGGRLSSLCSSRESSETEWGAGITSARSLRWGLYSATATFIRQIHVRTIMPPSAAAAQGDQIGISLARTRDRRAIADSSWWSSPNAAG